MIVRDDQGRFLLVHERKHGQLWFFPAGRVEPGETLEQGAIRETLEETSVPVELTGIYHVEHSPSEHGARESRRDKRLDELFDRVSSA